MVLAPVGRGIPVLMGARTVPRATYRVQLHAGFTFDDAAAVADYLAELGVSHLYGSPDLQAAPGSTHGYDVVDPTRVNVELGGRAGAERLHDALARHDLGRVVDVVPNHMATSLPENRWFWEVLEHGRSSRYAAHFDVDWDPPESSLRNRILLPLLGDHYGRVLEAGDLTLHHDHADFTVRYADHVFPVAPRSLSDLLQRAGGEGGIDDVAFVGRSLARLPLASTTDPAARRERHRDVEVLHRQLRRLIAEDARAGEAVDAEVARVNSDPDLLDALLENQNYRLAYWRAGAQDLDYRRFFDIDTLIGLRVEDPQVFADTHALILDRVRTGEVQGLRIDHPDGLRRPAQYLRRLRDAAPDAWIVVEKILEHGEPLRPGWPVDGTTGYDFLNDVLGLFVDPAGRAPLDDLWAELTGEPPDHPAVVESAKREVLRDVLAADLNRLTEAFVRVCEGRRRYRDFSRHELSEALAETLVRFDVYRTYVDEDGGADDDDRLRVGRAVGLARAGRDDLDPEVFDLLERILVGDPELHGPVETDLRMRFQQVSGPVMAKGVEDTAFYRSLRLAALCEVGGDPDRFGVDPADYHRRNVEAHERWPDAMLALSTHDTKRAEDTRARMALLSEIGDDWASTVRRWRKRNADLPGADRVDAATEYLLYQTLVGAHPLSADRARAYLEKATKEAKVHTSWIDPDPDYDRALAELVDALAADDDFQHELAGVAERLVAPGRVTALAQKLLQLTAPGVPDVYQGTELWDLSLVDPDNRRPVDYDLRRRLLAELRAGGVAPAEVWARADEGMPKLWVVHRTLQVRAAHPDAFAGGDAGAYEELPVSGPAAAHAVVACRGGRVATVVPRLVLGLDARGGWGDTTVDLPPGTWDDVLGGAEHGGGSVGVGDLLAAFPVALLVRSEP